jgi:hypothetical protein
LLDEEYSINLNGEWVSAEELRLAPDYEIDALKNNL